ncbi:MAG TPA: two-component regulator propeller domain-containing protein [Candidatus Angelobacter sp.]|nr:two-component regulator propeller domain-containing protein [Candidatus Angelobacter sp.]
MKAITILILALTVNGMEVSPCHAQKAEVITDRVLELSNSNEVTAITGDSDGSLWISTAVFSLTVKPKFFLPHVTRLTSRGLIAEEFEIKAPADDEVREAGFSVVALAVDKAKVTAILSYAGHDLWWVSIDRKTGIQKTHKIFTAQNDAISGLRGFFLTPDTVVVYGITSLKPIAMSLKDDGRIMWSLHVDSRHGLFVDALPLTNSKFVFLERDIDLVAKTVGSTVVVAGADGKIMAQRQLPGTATAVYLAGLDEVVMSAQDKELMRIVRCSWSSSECNEAKVSIPMTNSQIIALGASGSSVIGYQQRTLVYVQVSKDGDIIKRVPLQSDQSLLLDVQAKVIGSMVYLVGKQYVREADGVAEKVRFISFVQ